MYNPLAQSKEVTTDHDLVREAVAGSRDALDQLLRKHQSFIYNVAWKMSHNPERAKDLAQEAMIRIITKLSTFEFKSSFTTWAYRIVVNEFLQERRAASKNQFTDLKDYGEQLDRIPNPELTALEFYELGEQAKEMKMSCMSGMLMCLLPEQRLIYILGDTFKIDHSLGAEIFGVTPANFRVKLHRARTELHNFMNKKCGLVNKLNPCRCIKKAKALKNMGMLDDKSNLFNIDTQVRIRDFVSETQESLDHQLTHEYAALFRDHTAVDLSEKKTLIAELLDDDAFKRAMHLS